MDLRKVLRYGIWTCLFITPFLASYVADSMFFPFITGKNFAFRILVEIATAMWILLMFVDKEARPKRSWVLIATSAFLGTIFVADIFGANPSRSLWSNYERMEGFVCTAHLFLYFLVFGAVTASENVWGWFANTWLASSLIILWGAVQQIYGQASYNFGSGRVDAGLGNAAYMGIYALFNVFLAGLLWVRTDKKSWWRWAYPMLGLANLYLVFKSETRGSMLGLFAGALLVAALYALFDKTRPQLRKYATYAIVAAVILGGLFIANRKAAWVHNFPSLARIAAISTTDTTTKTRLYVWGISWHGFLQHPVLGWGQDNFLYVFGSKNYDPRMYPFEPWYDRSHDVFFDWLVAGGLLGLLTYLSIYGATLYYLWWYKKGEVFTLSEKAIVTGMLVGYFIHNIFVFDNLVSYMFFFALLGWIHSRVTLIADAPTAAEQVKAAKKSGTALLDAGDLAIVGSVLVVVLVLAIYFVNYRDMDANMMMLQSIRGDGGAVYVQDGKQHIRLLDALDEARIGKTEAREQLVQQTMQALQQKGIPDDLKSAYVTAATKEVDEVLANDPNDLRMRTFAMVLYGNMGDMKRAEQIFAEASALCPMRATMFADFGNVRLQNGDYEGAAELYRRALDIMPADKIAFANGAAITIVDQTRVSYAASLILSGKTADAKQVLALVSDDKLLIDNKLLYAYSKTGEIQAIVDLFSRLDAEGKMDSHAYLMYADALNKTGKIPQMIDALHTAAKLDPSIAAQVDAYIKTVKK